MAIGTMKWFIEAQGFGLIESDDGSADSFIRLSAVERFDLSALRQGHRVTYRLRPGHNGQSLVIGLSIVE